jgi:hypothetical protein
VLSQSLHVPFRHVFPIALLTIALLLLLLLLLLLMMLLPRQASALHPVG